MLRCRRANYIPHEVDHINTRIVNNKDVVLQDKNIDGSLAYVCPTNHERNALADNIFRKHIQNTCPKIDEHNKSPPLHTIIIQADLKSRDGLKYSQDFENFLYQHVGDAGCINQNNKRVDPCLKIYTGALFMINANDKLKDDNVGAGTTVSIKHIKLKPNTSLIWKNWEGFKVFTTSVNDIESIEVIKPDQSIMILVPKTETVTITCKSSTFDKNSTMKLYGVKITQFLIMTSIATTGHKIQGCSKDALIINTFAYGFSN